MPAVLLVSSPCNRHALSVLPSSAGATAAGGGEAQEVDERCPTRPRLAALVFGLGVVRRQVRKTGTQADSKKELKLQRAHKPRPSFLLSSCKPPMKFPRTTALELGGLIDLSASPNRSSAVPKAPAANPASCLAYLFPQPARLCAMRSCAQAAAPCLLFTHVPSELQMDRGRA